MLRDWLTAAFVCTVFLLVIRLVLRLVSVEALLFALLAVGSALVLPAVGSALLAAVGYALLPAVGYALSACCWLRSSRFFSLFLSFSTIERFRTAVLLAVLVPVLLLSLLFTTRSLAMVLSRIFSTGFLAVALSLILSRDTLW